MSKTIKTAFVWSSPDAQKSILYTLLKTLSKKKFEITSANRADFIIYGSNKNLDKLYHFYRYLKRKIKWGGGFQNFIDLYQMRMAFRLYKPVTLFFCEEPFRHNYVKTDFSYTLNHGVCDENHLRYEMWKECLDFSNDKIIGKVHNKLNTYKYRFGKAIKIEDLLIPQGKDFLNKEKKICLFSSYLDEPRLTIFNKFSKHFITDGYGPHFNKDLKTPDDDVNKKIDIMKKYAFNLCPENTIYPGFWSGRILDAFIGKCLPIAWCHHTINLDFNSKAFVNLDNYFHDNFSEIIENLKDEAFLKKFADEPCLLKAPTLDKEIKFAEKILNSL